jgi:ubiquinone/menaquinone biosynthesis C-methylase UbiE
LASEIAKTNGVLASRDLSDDVLQSVTQYVLANVLFALWDSGFFEFVAGRTTFSVDEAIAALGYDRLTFEAILENLAGRKLVTRSGDTVTLTERGDAYHNLVSRGLLTLFRGGYGGLLSNLGPLLRREITIDDRVLDRSGVHVGFGTECWASVRALPSVFAVLRERHYRNILDIGSGTGGFLCQWLELEPQGHGVGIDLSSDAVAEARRRADALQLSSRLSFMVAELGRRPLPLGDDAKRGIDCLTMMFMLHEFGRDGRDGILRILRDLREQFPDKPLLVVEMIPPEEQTHDKLSSLETILLDYLFIHPLSRQGRPRTPDDWRSLYDEAGVQFVQLYTQGTRGLHLLKL